MAPKRRDVILGDDMGHHMRTDVIIQPDAFNVDLEKQGDGEATKKTFRYSLCFWAAVMPTVIIVSSLCAVLVAKLHGTTTNAWRWPALFAFTAVAFTMNRLLFHGLMYLLHVFISQTRKVMYYVTGLQASLERLTDSAYLLAIFAVLFNGMRNMTRWVILRLLICFVLFCTTDFMKQSISKIAAARFHQKAYFDKMHRALKQEYFLSRLSKASRVRRRSMLQSPGRARRWRLFGITSVSVGRWVEREPGGFDDEEELRDLEYHLKQHQTLLQSTLSHTNSSLSLQHHAHEMATYIFTNLTRTESGVHKHSICLEDLQAFLKPKHAKEAFQFLDIDKSGTVSLPELKHSVTSIYRERAHLANTLNDTDDVLVALERIIGACLHIIFCLGYLLVFQVDITKVWLTFSSVLLASSFVFGPSLRSVFENAVFLFTIHPFDVGDDLIVGTDGFSVQKICLNTVVLKKGDGSHVYMPVANLNDVAITNLSRSGNAIESFKLSMDISTPQSVIEELRGVLTNHVENRPKEFTGKCSCWTVDAGDPLKLTLQFSFEFAFGRTAPKLNAARHKLYSILCQKLDELDGARYTMPPQILSTEAPLSSLRHGRQEVNDDFDDDQKDDRVQTSMTEIVQKLRQ